MACSVSSVLSCAMCIVMIVYCCAVCDAVSSVWTHAFAAYTLYNMPYSSIHVYSSHECYMYDLQMYSTVYKYHLGSAPGVSQGFVVRLRDIHQNERERADG